MEAPGRGEAPERGYIILEKGGRKDRMRNGGMGTWAVGKWLDCIIIIIIIVRKGGGHQENKAL